MMKTKWISRAFVTAIAVALLSAGRVGAVESPATTVTSTVTSTGQVVGVLTAKGESWIEVRADGAGAPVRFRARWIGGAPAAGGGYDRQTLEAIRRLVVSRRVRLNYGIEEGPRVLSVEMIQPPGDRPRAESGTQSGQGRGVVTAKGENWIEIRSQDVTQRYVPRWIGGMPRDGGGFDREMLRAIAVIRVGASVQFEWINDERKRIVVLRPA